MVLSILIPIYNYHCSELIETLHTQGKHALIDFEILLLDDGSALEYKSAHRKLSQLEHVIYEESDTNLGRSMVRNHLARKAKYPYLLFLDCDSKLTTNSFLRNYADHVEPNKVLYGGRIYSSIEPLDPAYSLHWRYGREREARSVEQRRRSPYLWFHSNNFVITKDLLLSLPFDESLSTYGYEDSLLSAELRKRDVGIKHMDNPVVHLGLIDNKSFLNKAHLALQNLHNIIQTGQRIPVRLVTAYQIIRFMGLRGFFAKRHLKNKDKQISNILSGNATLKEFDRYRLGYLLNLGL